MKHTQSEALERRAAIERELEERLRRDREQRQPTSAHSRAAVPAGPALECTACGGVSAAEARFCTHCGLQFNAIVVARAARLIASFFLACAMLFDAQAPAAAQQAGSAPPLLSTTPMPSAGASAEPAQMSGLPLQVGDLPPGTVAVRVIRRSFGENVPDQAVHLAVGAAGRALSETTDVSGRALFRDLPVGETVRASTAVDGEQLESQFFQLPGQGGVRLVLVAGAGAGIRNDGGSIAGPATPVPLKSPARDTTILGVATAVFALVGAGVGVSVLRGRRPTAQARGSLATAMVDPPPSRRETLFEALVQLEREHDARAVTDAVYVTDRNAFIDELVAIDGR